jgi:myosin heavy subunit
VKKIHACLQIFYQNNELLKQTLTAADGSIHALAPIREKITADIRDLEFHLENDIVRLATLIKENLFHEIVPLMTDQERNLKKEIVNLTTCVDQYREIETDLSKEKEQLKVLIAQEQITNENVEQFGQQSALLDLEMAKLSKEREALSQVEDHLHTDVRSLASTEKGFAMTEERLEALHKRLETALTDLNSV